MKDDSILRKRIFSGYSWTFMEKLLTEIISSFVAIVLSRLLYPSDYGLISLVQVFISISSILVETGLGQSLIQDKNIDEEQISTLFYLNVFLGLIVYFILFICSPIIAKFYNNESLILVIRVMCIKIPISSVYSIQHAYVRKNLLFKKFFYSSLFGTIFSGAIGIIMAYRSYGVWALVVASLTDQILDCIILFFTTKWIPPFRFKINKIRKQLSFSLKITFSEMASGLYGQIRSLIIGIKYSTEDLAYNSKGLKYPYMIVGILNSSINRVMLPTFSSLQDDKKTLKNVAKKNISISTYIISPLMFGMAITSYRFVPLIFTDKWNGCIPYIQLYCLLCLFNPIIATDIQIIQSCGDADSIFSINLKSIIIEIALLIASILFFDNPIAIVASLIVTNLLSIFFYNSKCKKLIDYGIVGHLDDVYQTYIISFLMSLVVMPIGLLKLSNLAVLILQISIGGIVYFVLSLLLKSKPLKYILEIIKK